MSNPYQLSLWDARESLFQSREKCSEITPTHNFAIFIKFSYLYVPSLRFEFLHATFYILEVFCNRKWQLLALYPIVSTWIMQTFILRYIWQILCSCLSCAPFGSCKHFKHFRFHSFSAADIFFLSPCSYPCGLCKHSIILNYYSWYFFSNRNVSC